MPRRTSHRARLDPLFLLPLLGACSSDVMPETPASSAPDSPPTAPPPAPAILFSWQPADDTLAPSIEARTRAAAAEVERFFGAPFPEPIEVIVHPDRAAFDASLPPEWGLARTECWMVATGVAAGIQLLSPRVWKSAACEHDPDDAGHVQELLAHELVHVYHGQHNPSPDFTGVSGIDWFVEGLATHASGQLESGGLATAREALAAGALPTDLASAWTGRFRYGVSGSLVELVDRELGRARLCELLAATTADELLAAIGSSEEELLARWRAGLQASADASSR